MPPLLLGRCEKPALGEGGNKRQLFQPSMNSVKLPKKLQSINFSASALTAGDELHQSSGNSIQPEHAGSEIANCLQKLNIWKQFQPKFGTSVLYQAVFKLDIWRWVRTFMLYINICILKYRTKTHTCTYIFDLTCSGFQVQKAVCLIQIGVGGFLVFYLII